MNAEMSVRLEVIIVFIVVEILHCPVAQRQNGRIAEQSNLGDLSETAEDESITRNKTTPTRITEIIYMKAVLSRAGGTRTYGIILTSSY